MKICIGTLYHVSLKKQIIKSLFGTSDLGGGEASQSLDALAMTGPPLIWPQPPPSGFLHLPLSHRSEIYPSSYD